MTVCGSLLHSQGSRLSGWGGIHHVRPWLSTDPSSSALGAALCPRYQEDKVPMSFVIDHPGHRKLTEWKTCQLGKETQGKQVLTHYTWQVENTFYLFTTFFRQTNNFWRRKIREFVFISIISLYTFMKFHWFVGKSFEKYSLILKRQTWATSRMFLW